MDIKIGSMTIRGEILLLIGFMGFILFAHLFGSCSRLGIEEGFEIAKQVVGLIQPNNVGYSSQFSQYPSVWAVPSPPKTDVSPANNLAINGSSDINTPFNNPPLKLDPALGYKPYQLPPGEMDILAVTKFSPKCCPNLYSNSEGCACPTVEQYNFIKERGGNNVPISEY